MSERSPGSSVAGLDATRVRVLAGDRALIDGVEVHAPAGSVTALVGPNGAGKSTLLRALAGIHRPAEGVVLFDDVDLFALSRRDRARRSAFVEQDTATDTAMTVASVVGLGRMPHQGLFGDAESDAPVADALATAGIAELAGRQFGTLSGGERQRVVLARALAQQPRLLVLDEPTNHLDVAAQLAVLRVLRTLAARGVAVVAALHDLTLAAAHADRVVVLRDGRVVAAGQTEPTLTPELIERVYGVRATVLRHPASGRPVLAFDPLDE
ncbi:MAG TPA: ABC transporter ATP-binding protein [Rhodoglobus sp.]|nr:ABC transporter ATP-binding protein [Rhodoglobus sp.]